MSINKQIPSTPWHLGMTLMATLMLAMMSATASRSDTLGDIGLAAEWSIGRYAVVGSTGFVPQLSSIDVQTQAGDPNSDILSFAKAEMMVTGSYGNLSVSASGTAAYGIDGGNSAFVDSSYIGDPAARYRDLLTIGASDPSLHPRDSVQFKFTELFVSSLSWTNPQGQQFPNDPPFVYDHFLVADQSYGYPQSVRWDVVLANTGTTASSGFGTPTVSSVPGEEYFCADLNQYAACTASMVVTAAVGDQLAILGEIYGFRSAWPGAWPGPPTSTQSPHASFEFSGDDPLYVDVLTPGAYYSAGSGTLYPTSQVPEPGTLLLLGVGLMSVAGPFCRHKSLIQSWKGESRG